MKPEIEKTMRSKSVKKKLIQARPNPIQARVPKRNPRDNFIPHCRSFRQTASMTKSARNENVGRFLSPQWIFEGSGTNYAVISFLKEAWVPAERRANHGLDYTLSLVFSSIIE